MHVMSYLWTAANALFQEGSKEGKRWVQQKLTDSLRGRVGYVIGGLRQILTKRRLRKSVRETLAKVITCFHNHRRWMPYDVYLAAGLPVGTGVVEVSQLYDPYTDTCYLSYYWPDWIIKPRRHCRQVTGADCAREREGMSTLVLPPRL